jgi:catechol 2,3-dioxygenase-like lactoylglutathione lyase family enzyme
MPSLDHINIHARDRQAMVAFLEAVLGAKDGLRPPFKHPGNWLYLDGKPVIHIDPADRTDDFPTGLYNHVAFGIYDFEPLLKRVEATGCRYELAGIPGGVGQIFVYGPEGVKLELQYHR